MHRSNGRLFMLQAELADWDKAKRLSLGVFSLNPTLHALTKNTAWNNQRCGKTKGLMRSPATGQCSQASTDTIGFASGISAEVFGTGPLPRPPKRRDDNVTPPTSSDQD